MKDLVAVNDKNMHKELFRKLVDSCSRITIDTLPVEETMFLVFSIIEYFDFKHPNRSFIVDRSRDYNKNN